MKAVFQSQRFLLAAAFATGAVSVAGFAPVGAFVVPILALTALLALWQRASSRGDAFLIGFAFGAGLFLTGASWVYVSLHDFGMMPAPIAVVATALFCGILALYPGIVGWFVARRISAHGMQLVLAFAALWTLAEWLRGWIFTGFPWLAVGYSQSDSPLAGFAPLLGVFGVSFATAACAGLLYLALVERGRARWHAVGGLAFVVAAGFALSLVSWTAPQGAPVRVALLQGNIPQDLKFSPQRYAATLATYRRLIAASDAQIIVLPETAIPRFLDSIEPRYLDDIGRMAREKRADLLLGVPLRERGDHYFNGVVSMGTSPAQNYRKTHLVPFGEFVPAGFGWIVKVLSIPLSDFSPGTDTPEPMSLLGQRVAPNICYEDAFGEEIIRQLPRATLLVNLSNIAWFGNSLAPAQHLQISRMRSIETGRYMLRSTNSGVTAIVDPRGKVQARLDPFTEGVLQGEVQGFAGATPYVRVGNYAVVLICIATLVALAFSQRRGAGRTGERR